MIGTANRALKFAHHQPEGVILQGRLEEYFRPFGYTIYRTAYDEDDPGQDQAWESLLKRLDADFKLEISNTFSSRQHIESERQDTEKLKSLATFDGRSDATFLNGCSVEKLRTIFEAGVGGVPLNADVPRFKYFLFADKEVLDGVAHGESWVKIAEVLYDDAQYDTKNHPRLLSKKSILWMDEGGHWKFILFADVVGPHDIAYAIDTCTWWISYNRRSLSRHENHKGSRGGDSMGEGTQVQSSWKRPAGYRRRRIEHISSWPPWLSAQFYSRSRAVHRPTLFPCIVNAPQGPQATPAIGFQKGGRCVLLIGFHLLRLTLKNQTFKLSFNLFCVATAV